jgi:hypothetical protein
LQVACSALFVAVFGNPAGGRVIYVHGGAAGNNNGTSWQHAYVEVSPALAAASAGDELWIAEGAYASGAGLTIPGGVAVYGGFVGTESAVAERDWSVHVSRLAGPGFSGSRANVLTATSPTAGTVLDGVTIADGYPVFSPGGGLYVSGGTMVVRNCTFQNNYLGWSYGAGLCAYHADLTVENCRFTGNYCHLGSGGAIALLGATSARITGCDFLANTVVTAGNGGEGQGAGLHNESTLPVSVTRCAFDGNIARGFYICQSGAQYAHGGGINSFAGGLAVRDCVFRNNQAHYGAGVFAWGNTTIINSVFHHNTATLMCVNDFLTVGGEGAAVGGWTFNPASLQLINCTLASNTGTEGVGAITYSAMSAVLHNTIVWGNTATGEGISPIDGQIKGTISVEHSCVQHLLEPIPGEDPPDPSNYPGCIVTDPQLVDPAGGDVHLAVTSPCVDAGRNSFVPVGVVNDLDGFPRFSDEPAVPDTGVGAPPIVDMGAYEVLPLVMGDMNCDAELNVLDLEPFVQVLTDVGAFQAAHPGCSPDRGDMNADGLVDGGDIQGFASMLMGP